MGVIACVSLIYSWYFLGLGKANSNYTSHFVIEQGIKGGDKIHLPVDEQFYRVDMNKGMDNQAMFWGIPTINAFHSIVPGSVMEFYPTIGIARGVGTRPEPEHYAVRSLLSTRYLFDYANEDPDYQEYKSSGDFFLVDGETKMPGWSYIDKQNGFLIYENDNYIPMGFTYDQYMTRESYDAMSESRRELALLKALVVEKADEPGGQPDAARDGRDDGELHRVRIRRRLRRSARRIRRFLRAGQPGLHRHHFAG